MRFFIAFFISLLIYTFLFWLYITKLSEIKPLVEKKSEHIIKIDIKNMPIIKEAPKPIPQLQPVVPQKKVIKKEIVKKKIIRKKVIKKKPKKVVKKIVKKKQVKKKKHIVKKKVVRAKPIIEDSLLMQPFEVLEPVTKVSKPVVEKENNSLSSFLGTPSQSVRQTRSHSNRKINKLYGSSFNTFTPTQKKFIEKNLDTIQSITQRVLTQRGYPEGAGRTNQEGTNVVSFNLHPNGTISDLRLKTRIGYRALDDNTLSLIRTAYREYPYPSTTTRIIFYVTYSIYGY